MPSDHKQKIICLGLGRTGTSSLRDALEILGFGPSYHMSTIMAGGGKDYAMWCKIGDGNATSEDIQTLLRDYGAVLDYPAAMHGPELYSIYPDAKYILTVRDPVEWEISMKATIMQMVLTLREVHTRTPVYEALMNWSEAYMQKKYHRGRMFTHSQQELIDHNERVKQLIPPEKLLIYEIGEGWERLAEFLGVPMPTMPFPHVFDTAQFLTLVQEIRDYAGENQVQQAVREEGSDWYSHRDTLV